VTFSGAGISQVAVVNNEVSVQAKPGFSGKTTVKVSVTTEEEVSQITAQVIVIPLPVINPVAKLVSDTKSRVQWIRSPNAVSYVVTQDGKVLCATAGTMCTIPQAISAASPVEVKALGRDSTESIVKQASYVAPATPAATTSTPSAEPQAGALNFEVYFDMNSVVITDAEKAKIASQVKLAMSKAAKDAIFTIQVVGWVQPNPSPGNIDYLSKYRADHVGKMMQSFELVGIYDLVYGGLGPDNLPKMRHASVLITWDKSKPTA
jgi:outer membrane protein OmpA-like peptidoglycan-associated protein